MEKVEKYIGNKFLAFLFVVFPIITYLLFNYDIGFMITTDICNRLIRRQGKITNLILGGKIWINTIMYYYLF